MKLIERYAVEIILNLLSFAVALIIGIVCFVFFPDGAVSGGPGAVTHAAAYTGFVVGLLTTFALTSWLLAIKSAIDVAEIRGIAKANDERLTIAIAHGEDSRSQILNRLQQLEGALAPANANLDRSWAAVYPLVRNAGKASYKDYSQKFQTTDHGYEVSGEDWSLSAYARVWERLVETQKQIEADGSNRVLIARVTHSNDIEIWNANGPFGRSRAEGMLSLQRDFIKHGGIIVRLLLYRPGESIETYTQVKEAMEEIGIETRLCELDLTDEAEFDFLWATTAEDSENQHCVVKWFPVIGGRRLARCEITDLADEDVRRLWRHFAIRSEGKEGSFRNIPKDRQTS
jgi:hypothetical protein